MQRPPLLVAIVNASGAMTSARVRRESGYSERLANIVSLRALRFRARIALPSDVTSQSVIPGPGQPAKMGSCAVPKCSTNRGGQ